MGLVAIVAGLIYGILHYYWLHKREYEGRDEDDVIGDKNLNKIKSIDHN